MHYTTTELEYPRCGAKLGRAVHKHAPVTQDITKVTCAKCLKLVASFDIALDEVRKDPRIADVESEGCDHGRVFIHLRPGYVFAGYDGRSKTVGSSQELREVLSRITAV